MVFVETEEGVDIVFIDDSRGGPMTNHPIRGEDRVEFRWMKLP
jgi:hypothetical protein